ncbi:MAG: hypothetical protein V3W28_02135 [Thermoplasmata archaeon]
MVGIIQPLTRRRELYDYTAFAAPAADLTTTSAEEIEIDQALSLAGRRGRRLFGVYMTAVEMWHLTSRIADTADTRYELQAKLATRTGSFTPADPELLWQAQMNASLNVTEGSATDAFWDDMPIPPGGEVYVAPRLFWRVENDLGVTITAADPLGVRFASISQALSFQTFIELLERFADVTLL